jgi:hypothetical protein
MTKTEKERRKDDRIARFYEHYTPEATHLEEGFRHGHWKARRARVTNALAAAHTGEMAMTRWRCCGSGAVVEREEGSGKLRVKANYCHSRHCEPCARSKARLIAMNLKSRLGTAHRNEIRFVTLTQRSSDAPLIEQITKLYRNFKKLRSKPLWKNTQGGGAFFLEVKRNGTHWHAHLHILTAGKFMRVHDLSALWKEITGDSFIVDVRAVTNTDHAAHYVTKYLAKGTSPEVWNDPDAAEEWVIAIKGVRACATFGQWRAFRLLARAIDNGIWTRVDTLHALCARSIEGEVNAMLILKLLTSTRPTQDEPHIFNPD